MNERSGHQAGVEPPIAPKVGRNEPCPCGSGRKHKHCCLTVRGDEPLDLRWRRLHRLTVALPVDLMAFARRAHGLGPLYEAWREFMFHTDEPFDGESIQVPLFVPWFLHDWTPDPFDTAVAPERLDEFPISDAYLRRHRARLDPLLVRYIDACHAAPFSFHDVISVIPGTGFNLRDIIRGGTVEVTERSASETVEAGSILLARVVSVDGLAVLDGCAPIAFPPIEKAPLLKLRRFIRKPGRALTDEQLKDYDLEMFSAYHEIAERVLNPVPPVLQNTDGETLQFCTISYEIESPRAVFDALSGLAAPRSEDELLHDAAWGADGELEHVEFSWLRPGNAQHPSWEHTVLGRIVIDGRRLVVEVNSESRAKGFQAFAEESLPPGSRHVSMVIEPFEAARKRLAEERSAGGSASDSAGVDLSTHPEIRAKLSEMRRAHYREWVHMELPALEGKTPMQAMRSRDGREMVEALLTQFEQAERRSATHADDDIIAELRATLSAAARRPRRRGPP